MLVGAAAGAGLAWAARCSATGREKGFAVDPARGITGLTLLFLWAGPLEAPFALRLAAAALTAAVEGLDSTGGVGAALGSVPAGASTGLGSGFPV